MSTLKVNNLQVGQDATASNNFTLYQPAVPDGTVRLGVGNSGSVTDILTLKNSNLGVGTDNPLRKLDILGTGRPVEIGSTNASNIVKLYNSATGRSTYNGVDITSNSTAGGIINAYGGYLDFGTSSSNGTNATSRLHITSDGNIGIGTENPGQKLQVQDGHIDVTDGTAHSYSFSYGKFTAQRSSSQSTFEVFQGGYGATITSKIYADGKAYFLDNFGIGTTDPAAKLTVDKGAPGGANQVIGRFQAESSRRLDIVWHDSGSLMGFDTPSNHTYTFKTGGTERLRITNDGNINIQTGGSLSVTDSNNNASGQASTTGAINCNLIRPYNNSNSSWNGVYFLSRNAVGGGAKSVGIVETGLRVGSFTNDLSATERIKLGTDGTITSDYGTSDGNHVYFRNDEVGFFIGSWGTGSTYPRECTLNASRVDNGTFPFLRLAGQGGIKFAVDLNSIRGSILTTGEFRIGTTSQVTVSGDAVHSVGTVNLANNTSNLARIVMQERTNNWISFKDGGGTHYGTIARNGSGVTYGSNSDYRLKNNVENFSGGIDLVKRLRPVTFNWNELSGNEDTTSTQRGFLAHEVQEVEPAAVSGEKDEMDRYGDCYDAEGRRTQINVFEHQAKEGETWTFTSEHIRDQQLDPAKLVPILTAALKEAITKIETLESRVADLEG